MSTMAIHRLSSRLRSLALYSTHSLPSFSSSSSINLQRSVHSSSSSWRPILLPIFSSPTRSSLGFGSLRSSQFPISMVQVRHVSSRDRRSKRKKVTPAVSKVKKIKMKPYSSYKLRFRTLSDGTIRRWKQGKRHNAHSKSKEAKRRLRRPGIVHPAFATVMKKLNFSG